MSTRQVIPKAVRDQVLGEYNHLCAICAAPNPQIHHIDEDHSNNDPMNLLPLCPNHHLSDQHNPTRRIEPDRVMLFRRFKDPAILSAQFEPLHNRLGFFRRLDVEPVSLEKLEASAKELVAFVAALEMGDFYAKQIGDLIKKPSHARTFSMSTPSSEVARWQQQDHAEYVHKLQEAREAVIALSVELLRYQDWKPAGI